MDSMRKPFFVVSLVLILLVVAIETGSHFLPPPAPPACLGELKLPFRPADVKCPPFTDQKDWQKVDWSSVDQLDSTPPGMGIPYMALLDVILLLTMGIIGASLVVPKELEGRVEGCVTLVVGILIICGGIAAILAALTLVLVMIGLLLAVPFGTLTYLAIYGFFDRGSSAAILSLLMLLKIGAAVCLVLAHQRFLQNKGLVLLVLTSLIANVIVDFLQGFPPGILVSITDGIAAIIVGILAVIWAIFLVLFALPSILKALRFQT